jgi:hypothetical protein
MNPILAILSPEISAALSALAIIITILIGGSALIEKVRGRGLRLDQPVEITHTERFAPRDQVEKIQVENISAHGEITERIDVLERDLRADVKRDIGDLYTVVNKLREDVAALNQATNSQDNQIQRVMDKLDDILRRLPRA